ncbi:hypothetical protein Tco_1064568 [Tanacetum coccineum]
MHILIVLLCSRALLCYKGTHQPDSTGETNEPGRLLKQFAIQTYEEKLDKNTDPLLHSELPSTHSRVFSDGQPSSFTNVRPSSFGNPSSFSNVQPSSFGHSSSFTNVQPSSFGQQRPLSGNVKLVSNAATMLYGPNMKLPDTVDERKPMLSYQQLHLDQSIGYLPSIEASSLKEQPTNKLTVINDPLFTIDPSKQINILPVIEASSSQEQRFLLHPLFTMKRLDQYIHGPNEEFLAQFVGSNIIILNIEV